MICNICSDDKKTIKCNKCTFVSCNECIKKWYVVNTTCPQCRNILTFKFELELVLKSLSLFQRKQINELELVLESLSLFQRKQIKELKIGLFVARTCPWSIKAIKSCSTHGIINDISIIYADTMKFPENVNSVPTWISMNTGKMCSGFKPINEIIKDLS